MHLGECTLRLRWSDSRWRRWCKNWLKFSPRRWRSRGADVLMRTSICWVALLAVGLSGCQLLPTSKALIKKTVVTSMISSTTVTFPVVLNNWGATMAIWDQNHTVDPRAPSAFWPRLSDGRDTYTSLIVESGVVVGFTFALYPSISLALAKGLALSLLPLSEKQISTAKSASCLEVSYSRFDHMIPVAFFVFDPSMDIKTVIFSVDTRPKPDQCVG
ncbi:unnamed protein product [Acidithrix sp. C25]|nr:unnamed protein product [Acidithrix sp. C25]